VAYSAASNSTGLVVSQFSNVEAWVKEWKINLDQLRALLKLVSATLNQSNRRYEAHNFLVKYLETFEDAPEPALGTTLEEAILTSVNAIMLPEAIQCDHLLELRAIKQLASGDVTQQKLYQLLGLFATEKLEAFRMFHQNNPDFLSSVPGLVYEDCVRKMRLLSLASLGSDAEELPYSVVADTLSITDDEVETWVIRAISAKLLDAKLDQQRNMVIINQCAQRIFNMAKWKQLESHLSTWRTTVNSLLKVIQTSKEQSSVLGVNPRHQQERVM